MIFRLLLSTCLLSLLLMGCASDPATTSTSSHWSFPDPPSGTLFIIGGGQRPPALVQQLIWISEVQHEGKIVILPMASAEPDSAFYYSARQFSELGVQADRILDMNVADSTVTEEELEHIRNARLIYISGGDQARFMEASSGRIRQAIRGAYLEGSTIAGTSAGAAVMSQVMITGDERKHPTYTGDFRTIEADNLIYANGLGLFPQAIVDQHFVYRMRMNRLMAATLEHPGMMGIGIDESTAFIYHNGWGKVMGSSQVIVLAQENKSTREQEGLLGGENLSLSILLPGDSLWIGPQITD